MGSVSKSFSDTVPPNAVISQNPVAGSMVPRGSAVNLVVAARRPKPRAHVPNVVGLHKNQAVAALQRAGLTVGTITAVNSDSLPAGQILAQSPAANARVFRGSAVNLTLSDGPRKVSVPRLVGMTLDAATQVLHNAGLNVGTVGKQLVPGGTGLVVSQTPGAGQHLPDGSAVNLTLGVAPAGIQVPGVIGLTQDQARTALIQAGLQLGTTARRDPGPASIANNTVLDQNPAMGSYIRRGGRVNVTIAWHEPQSVRVPNLRGLMYRIAVEQLSTKRLKVGRVDHRTVAGPQVGKVIDQNPSANTRVWEGTAVNLVVGVRKREKLVLVPGGIRGSDSCDPMRTTSVMEIGKIRHWRWARHVVVLAAFLLWTGVALGVEEGGPEALPKGFEASLDKGLYTCIKDQAAMVWVAKGKFTRGADSASEGDEGPPAEVEVGGFLIDRFEVTNGQYKKFLAWFEKASEETRMGVRHPDEPETHDHRPAYWPTGEEVEGEAPQEEEYNRSENPVVGVSWFSAYAYARWAGKDLPTECEWEKAAASGDPGKKKRQWPWGETAPDFTKCNFAGNVGHPVRPGSYPAGVSRCGIHDMAGNVWEWCLDYYHKDFYKTETSKKADPRNLFPSSHRVVRGGSYISRGEEVRSAFRDRASPKKRYRDVGFRCVKRFE
jgi:beta-lactam-binding protein with PASTA domain/formylglycine-generating enzyme required for sulfatase activity